MSTLLLEGGHVVAVDRAGTVYEDGFVLVEDDRIAAVGPRAEAPAGADERLQAHGCVVVPGFVNTHQHHWYNLFKGLGTGMLLEQWISGLLVPAGRALTDEDLAVAARLSCLEMLRSGTTTSLDHSVVDSGEERVAAVLEPVLDSGMRWLYAKEIRPEPLDAQLAVAEAVHARWDGAGESRIRVAFVVETTAHWVALGTSSPELVQAANDLAGRLGARVSDHVAGGTMSRESGYLKFVLEFGRTDVEYLHELGVLDEKWILAHAIHATDRDIERIAEARASVSHTPTSESSRGGGITPVRRMLEAGVNVALGSDGPMVDTSVDMVEQMKAVRLFQNQLHLDPSAVTPERALAMATIGGARALGLEHEIGSLEPGKQADIAVVDLTDPACAVWHDAVGALVHSARGRDARHVLVAGEPLIRDGDFTRHAPDEVAAIVREARERSIAAAGRAGLRAPARLAAPVEVAT